MQLHIDVDDVGGEDDDHEDEDDDEEEAEDKYDAHFLYHDC